MWWRHLNIDLLFPRVPIDRRFVSRVLALAGSDSGAGSHDRDGAAAVINPA